MQESIKILDIKQLTHDVKQFTLQKPSGYNFTPGQATEVAIDKKGWQDKKRPFTFTSLPEDETLEFIIKIYADHDGVTKKLDSLKTGDKLLIDDPWGTIEYKGKGVFLAGGAGITPFISIFRQLHKEGNLSGNSLIFSNKSDDDIILRDELSKLLGRNLNNVITQTAQEIYVNSELTYLREFIDKEFLKNTITDFSQNFYVCGPPAFNTSMVSQLSELGAKPDALVFEH